MLANRSTLIFVAFSHSAQDLAESWRVAHVEVRLGRARSRGLAWTDYSVGVDVEAPHWSVSVAALLTALAAVDEVAQRSQLLEKKLAKVLVEDCVDDGVEGGAEVAEPEEDLEHEWVKVAAGAHAHREVDGEEGRPAHDEDGEHDAQHLDGFPLRLDAVLLIALRKQDPRHFEGGLVLLHEVAERRRL